MKPGARRLGRWMSAAVVAGLAAATAWAHPAWANQPAPGTAARPILSAAEAAPFAPANYLGWSGEYAAPVADPWRPRPIATHRPDFVVTGTGVRGFTSVQEAVNAAFEAGGTARRSIAILPGTYRGTVFIPAGSPPLTLYGVGPASEVRLEFTVDATITPAAWAALVNPDGRYAEGDPAWPMFRSCATRTSATAGLCATVVWAQSTDLQLKGLTITNGLLDTHCLITADEGYRTAPTGFLGRAWDQGAGATGYLPGITPNGQLVIRDTVLGEGFRTTTPWAPAATTARPFSARTDEGRDLNDVNHNRLWEHANRGPGATTSVSGG